MNGAIPSKRINITLSTQHALQRTCSRFAAAPRDNDFGAERAVPCLLVRGREKCARELELLVFLRVRLRGVCARRASRVCACLACGTLYVAGHAKPIMSPFRHPAWRI